MIGILASAISFSQMIVNQNGEVFENKPFFNKDFIQKHNIKFIRGNYSTKLDMDIIRPNDDRFVYEFDKLGQLYRQYKIHMNDTLVSTYQYDYKGNVLVHKESNRVGYYEYRYTYDQQGRITSLETRRDYLAQQNKLSFDLDQSKIIAKETYEYEQLEGIDYKLKAYNGSGRIYKVQYYYHNENGQLTEMESALHNGRSRTKKTYQYNENGQLISVTELSGKGFMSEEEKSFEYDEFGRLSAKKIYRNKKLLKEDQIVYQDNNDKLRAIISRGEAKNKLTILKFDEYRFY